MVVFVKRCDFSRSIAWTLAYVFCQLRTCTIDQEDQSRVPFISYETVADPRGCQGHRILLGSNLLRFHAFPHQCMLPGIGKGDKNPDNIKGAAKGLPSTDPDKILKDATELRGMMMAEQINMMQSVLDQLQGLRLGTGTGGTRGIWGGGRDSGPSSSDTEVDKDDNPLSRGLMYYEYPKKKRVKMIKRISLPIIKGELGERSELHLLCSWLVWCHWTGVILR